uniref:Uncharacterized protein n=1 Tax=Anguilla anguilla TaxID=7936 RepID=A0A0E9XD34_ANGAN
MSFYCQYLGLWNKFTSLPLVLCAKMSLSRLSGHILSWTISL